MLHPVSLFFQGLLLLTLGVLYAMWVVRVVFRFEARIDRYYAEARKRRIKLVVAGNYGQALAYAQGMKWGRDEWRYLSSPRHVNGLSNVTIHQAGEYWLSPIATEVDFRHAYAGVKLVKETDESSTGSAAEGTTFFWPWITPEWKQAHGIKED